MAMTPPLSQPLDGDSALARAEPLGPQIEPPFPSRRTAWYTVAVLMLCYTLSYADRQILAFLVTPIKHDLQVTDTAVGLLQGFAFAAFYTFFGLPLGALADWTNRRNLILVGLVLWSAATSASSIAGSFAALALARTAVGIGEATLSPAGFSMITDSFPKERLSSALSVYTMGIQVGSGLALLIGGIVVQAVAQHPSINVPLLGPLAAWRITFLIVGLPGLAMALLLLTVKEPTRRAIRQASGDLATARFGDVLEQIISRWRSVVGLALMIASQATCNYALLAWGPTFFERIHHWPRDRTGIMLGLMTLGCGCLGLLAGGGLADRWQRRGVTDAGLRVGLISLVGVASTLSPAMLLHSAPATVALLAPAVFFIGLPIGSGYAAVQIIFSNRARGLVSAIIIFAVALIGLVLGPLLPALFSDHWFHDPQRIGDGIALTVALASAVGILAVLPTRAHYRADYRAAVHPASIASGSH